MACESGRCYSDGTCCGMYGFCSETIGRTLPAVTKIGPQETDEEAEG